MKTRVLWLALTCAIAGIAGIQATAQKVHESGPPVSFGIYADLAGGGDGYLWGGAADGHLGAYGEWSRHAVRPGIDVRHQVTDGVVGTLAGPRLSMRLGKFHPYAAGLFGPSYLHVDSNDANGNPVQQDKHGLLSEAAVGVEWERARWLRWRIVEVTSGHFTGAPNSNPIDISTGLVVRFP